MEYAAKTSRSTPPSLGRPYIMSVLPFLDDDRPHSSDLLFLDDDDDDDGTADVVATADIDFLREDDDERSPPRFEPVIAMPHPPPPIEFKPSFPPDDDEDDVVLASILSNANSTLYPDSRNESCRSRSETDVVRPMPDTKSRRVVRSVRKDDDDDIIVSYPLASVCGEEI